MSSSACAAPHFGLSGAPVFHIRAKCKARFSALPARALHKGPFRGQQSRSRKCGEVWDRRSGRIARFVQSGVNSTYRKRNGPRRHSRQPDQAVSDTALGLHSRLSTEYTRIIWLRLIWNGCFCASRSNDPRIFTGTVMSHFAPSPCFVVVC